MNLFCAHLAPFSETWPKSGSMRNGRAYARPTQGRLTVASGSSSSPGLLPTPVVTNRAGMSPSAATLRGTRGTDLGPAIGELLKTPTAQLAVNGGSQHPDKRKAGGHGPTLADQVEYLLPTPTAADGERASASYARGNPTLGGALLPTPSVADALGGHLTRGGDRSRELLLGGIVKLLPSPAAHDSGSSPAEHLRKKPGRSQVTSLQVIVDYDLLPTGGRTASPLPAGGALSAARLPGQLSLDEPGSG